jgi:hypothetical protein
VKNNYWDKNFHISDFADIAEEYPVADSSIEAGDVVKISEDGKIEKTNSPYDDKILGIISEKPAINLGMKDWFQGDCPNCLPEKSGPIALSGRVLVKVSTENGKIKPGDYLTSSSQPRIAMKATKPGRVIGIALESFDREGIGKIKVFVNPHWWRGSF